MGQGVGQKLVRGQAGLLSTLLSGLLSVGQLYPLKVGQDTRGNGRGMRLVTKGGYLFGCKMAYKAS